MKQKTLKTVASAMVLTLGLSVMPAPAYAVSTNIVAETQGKTTLTLSQIQDLAVIYNDTVDTLELSMKQIELQEQMTRNQKRKAQNSLDDLDVDMSAAEAGLAQMKMALDAMKPLIESGQATPEQQLDYMLLQSEYQSNASNVLSMNQQLDSAFDQTMDAINQLNDALDTMAENKKDLEQSMKDLEQIMRYTSAKMALSIVQLEDSVKLLESQLAMVDKSIQVFELQQKLGMTTSLNVDTQKTSKVELENTLNTTKEQLEDLKRSLNVLIGRNAANPLEVVPMKLSGVITPAPQFTPELVNKFVEVNPKMETLLDERQDLKDSVKSDMGSDEKQQIEYQIQAKNQELTKQRQAAENELKSRIATINSNAVNYRVSKEKLAAEQKNYDIALKKFELGMISQMQLLQAEATLAQAELTNLSNGYQHYFDWLEYNLAKQGIDLNSMM
ncbi:MAG: TolC family protein [Peptococcaceae bacterium]|nr:TolC family protein [Peptococcaceae bacterium]